MQIRSTLLPGVVLIELAVHRDARGYFLETWQARRYQEMLELNTPFVQHNQSYSGHGVLRGLHYQRRQAQGKLVRVVQGRVFDVAVDVRVASPTFGRWFGITLSGIDAGSSDTVHQQLWIPPGFAHGFQVLSGHALVEYMCTDFYAPEDEHCLSWNDPDVGIDWPLAQPVLSERDASGKRLRDLRDADELPSLE